MSADNRAMRFGYLLSEIEVRARQILDGAESPDGAELDVPFAVELLGRDVDEAREIAREISREALDKVTGE